MNTDSRGCATEQIHHRGSFGYAGDELEGANELLRAGAFDAVLITWAVMKTAAFFIVFTGAAFAAPVIDRAAMVSKLFGADMTIESAKPIAAALPAHCEVTGRDLAGGEVCRQAADGVDPKRNFSIVVEPAIKLDGCGSSQPQSCR